MSNCHGEDPVIFTGIISSSEVAVDAEAPPTLAFFGFGCKRGKLQEYCLRRSSNKK